MDLLELIFDNSASIFCIILNRSITEIIISTEKYLSSDFALIEMKLK